MPPRWSLLGGWNVTLSAGVARAAASLSNSRSTFVAAGPTWKRHIRRRRGETLLSASHPWRRSKLSFFLFFHQLKPTALAVVFLCFYVLFCFCFFFPCMENKHKARWGCWGIRYWLHLAGGTDVTNTKGGKGRKRLLCISVETPRTGSYFSAAW